MEVLSLGIELEMQLQAYATATAMKDPQLTEPGQALNIEHTSSQMLVRSVSRWATMGTPNRENFYKGIP